MSDKSKAIPFQDRVQPWLLECFGQTIASDTQERSHRFLEEALELVQACGCTQSEAHQLVDYVYGREVGEKHQEVGGVMVTLAALCLAQQLDMHDCGEVELARVWTKVEQIRAKQAAKPKYSPLPQHVAHAAPRGDSLRESVANLTDEHQRLLVQVAFHALDDVRFSVKLAQVMGLEHNDLIGEHGYVQSVLGQLFDLAQNETAAATN